MLTSIKEITKKQAKKLISLFGYKIYPKNCLNCPSHQLITSINYLGVDTIIDIGANKGQFGELVYEAGFRGKIISFEPLKTAHEALLKLIPRYPNWVVAKPMAIGKSSKEEYINVCSRSSCSSILTMLKEHKDALPNLQTTHQEKIFIQSLDNVLEIYLPKYKDTKYLIKIDVQGYEWNVILGAQQSLKSATAVFCEVSLKPLFETQKLWMDIITYLEKLDFKIWAIQKAFINEQRGEDLQLNILFVKNTQ